MKDTIAQIVGILALIVMVCSYQMKQRKNLLILQIVANVLFIINYFLLGAMSGVVMNLINVARSYVFANDDKAWAKSRWWLWLFVAAAVIGGILSWEGPLSLFMIAATVILNFALYCKNGALMRKLLLMPPLLYISYNVINKAFGAAGSDIFCFVSDAIAIWRFDRKKEA